MNFISFFLLQAMLSVGFAAVENWINPLMKVIVRSKAETEQLLEESFNKHMYFAFKNSLSLFYIYFAPFEDVCA